MNIYHVQKLIKGSWFYWEGGQGGFHRRCDVGLGLTGHFQAEKDNKGIPAKEKVMCNGKEV